MGSSQALLTAVHTLSTLLNVACQVGLLVIVCGAVRRHRPDAWRPLLTWAIAGLSLAIVSPLLYMLTSSVVGRSGGIDAFIFTQAALTTVMMLLHVGLVVLLARGLVRVAQPPKPVVVEGAGAYR